MNGFQVVCMYARMCVCMFISYLFKAHALYAAYNKYIYIYLQVKHETFSLLLFFYHNNNDDGKRRLTTITSSLSSSSLSKYIYIY